ncbi:MAG TPA: acyl carrier protein [Ktedonobacterales bacterium]|jgi:acyl carrier protein|nr:acyl carrier protein [Ktedonobacterales bacterium]
MSKEEILAKLKPEIAKQLGVDEAEVKDDASFTEDLNADSLDLVELIMSLEEQFQLQIPDEDAEKLTTVGEAVEYIYEHTN